MKKMIVFAALLMTLCLAAAAARTEKEDYSEIAGTWYTEEISMNVTDEGRFVIEWFDGDWIGSLETDRRTNEDEEDYPAYRIILEEPKDVMWEDMELIPDLHHPGKLTLWFNGHPGDVFWNVPVYVTEVSDEDLEYYEPYTLIDEANGEEPAVTLMFTLLRPATDIAVMAMFNQETDEEGNLEYKIDVLEWWEELDSQEHIAVKHVFEGDLPDLSISFLVEDGTRYDFAVQISGVDGEIELLPLLPSNG